MISLLVQVNVPPVGEDIHNNINRLKYTESPNLPGNVYCVMICFKCVSVVGEVFCRCSYVSCRSHLNLTKRLA